VAPEPTKDEEATKALARVEEFESAGADTEALLKMLRNVLEQHQGTPAAIKAEQKIIKIEVTIVIQRATDALEAGDIEQAKVIIGEAGDSDLAKGLIADIKDKILEAERETLAAQKAAAVKLALDAAGLACDNGDWAGARTAAQVLQGMDTPDVQALFVRIEAGERRDAAIAASQAKRGEQDWAGARAALDGIPDDEAVTAERAAIDLAERLENGIRTATEAIGDNRASDALTALEGLPESDPRVKALREAATREKAIQDGLAEAAELRDGDQLEQAKSVLEALPAEDPRVASALDTVQQLMAKQSAAAATEAKRKALAAARKAVEQAKAAISSGDWAAATAQLRKARTAGAGEVSAELARLEQSIKDAQAAWAAAQKAAEEGRNADARKALAKLKDISPGHDESLKLESGIKDLAEGVRDSGTDTSGVALFRNVKDGAILVKVAGGTYPMGRDGGGDEGPAHRITLTPFLIDRDEVTNRRYKKFLDWQKNARTPHEFCHRDEVPEKDHRPKWWDESGWSDPARPVVGVDWYDAYAYARWAGMTLPTEAQWEAAARGEKGSKFPWGDGADPKRANVGERHLDINKVKAKHWRSRMDRVASWSVTTDNCGASPRANSWCGARDMCGNVWEWCLDVYDPKAYEWRMRRAKTDPLRKGEGERIVRGGSWYLPLSQATTTNRFRLPPFGGNDRTGIRARSRDVGFRCVRKE
jgi:formylglycine-generating enzyme required for sulfatase activity